MRLGDVDVEVIVGLVMFPRATLAVGCCIPAAAAIVSWRRLFFDFDIVCSIIDYAAESGSSGISQHGLWTIISKAKDAYALRYLIQLGLIGSFGWLRINRAT